MYKIPLPQSLEQGGLKIGIDALLLTAFVLHHKLDITRFVELGVGNGLASCALGMHMPNSLGFGVDIVPEAIESATASANTLGMQTRLHFELAHVGELKKLRTLYHEQMGKDLADMVITNPPYRIPGTGRVSKDAIRRKALHQEADTLESFCKAGVRLLKHHGHFFCIYAPAHLPKLLSTLQSHGFGIRQMLPVHSRPNRSAQWILVHAQKHACTDMKLLAHLTIYENTENKKLSTEILSFCPWIE